MPTPSDSRHTRTTRACTALLVATLASATGCNHESLSPAPTDLEHTTNLVLEGRIHESLSDYDLQGMVWFRGRGLDGYDGDCENYEISRAIITTAAYDHDAARIPIEFVQDRGEFSRNDDGTYKLVIPVDFPESPTCRWYSRAVGFRLVSRDPEKPDGDYSVVYDQDLEKGKFHVPQGDQQSLRCLIVEGRYDCFGDTRSDTVETFSLEKPLQYELLHIPSKPGLTLVEADDYAENYVVGSEAEP